MGVVSTVTWSQYDSIDPRNFNEKHKCYVELELELELEQWSQHNK